MQSGSGGRAVDNLALVMAGGPVLLNTAGLDSARVSMKDYARIAFVIGVAPASGTDASAVTLKQSKTVADSPSTEKALSFSKVYKCGAPGTSDTLVETTVTNDTFSTSAAAALELWVIEVNQDDLDTDNGFDCVRVRMSDPGSVSTPAFILAIGYDARFPSDVSRKPSMIVD